MRASGVRLRALLVALVGIAALLRFGTLGWKGLWGDEISTIRLVHLSYPEMLRSIARLESTPPLYYSLAWLWAKLFGAGTVAIRSLPALVGVATVPVTYVAARQFVSVRAAVMAAALVAVNPLLVWYSQEARSYALLVFLGAVGLWCFARASREPSAGRLAAWAAASSAALATHYFAVFLVLPQTFLLVRGSRGRRAVIPAVGVVGLAGAALFPLALHQASFGHADWISHSSLIARLVALPGLFIAGFDAPSRIYAIAGTVAALAGGYMVARRSATRDRRGAARLAGLAMAGLAVPVALALVGVDYFSGRNSLAALVPLVICLSAGLTAPGVRSARVVSAAVLALSLTVVAATAGQPKFHSEDWRSAIEDLPRATVARAIVAVPGQSGRKSLEYYLDATPVGASLRPRAREVDIVALPEQGSSHVAERLVHSLLELRLHGFHLAGIDRESDFILLTYRAAAPVAVSAVYMERQVGGGKPMVVYQAHRA